MAPVILAVHVHDKARVIIYSDLGRVDSIIDSYGRYEDELPLNLKAQCVLDGHRLR
jgi:hypothetical protein